MPATFFSYAFRPFFLLNSLFAVGAIALWVFILNNQLPGLQLANPMLWHGHEMLVGFALGTIAGFLLTAVATWTGLPAVQGAALMWLVATWLAGRAVMLAAGVWPYEWVALIDMLFPLSLVVLIAREIITGGSQRNYPMIVITALIALLNLGYHLGAGGVLPGFDRTALFLLMHLVLLMITVIGGRIIPNFTANWMRARNKANPPVNNVLIDRLTLLLTVCTGLAVSLMPVSVITGVLAAAAAVVHATRLAGWRGAATFSEPLLFVLHAAYAWLPIGYALTAMSVFGVVVPPGAALHALTMGATGMMILAVTTRVALAHTGRALHASRITVISYVIFAAAVLVRVVGPLLPVNYMSVLDAAASGWMLSFVLFAWVYWPVLTRPRVDGE